MGNMYSVHEIHEIIYTAILEVMENKNHYIALNGYTHTEILNRFDIQISTLLNMYSKFERK